MDRPGPALEEVFRREHGLVLASLVRTFGDFDLAEEALAEAAAVAMETWSSTGVPDRPAGWLLTVARRKGIDRLRREKRLAGKLEALADTAPVENGYHDGVVPDERLLLIFACCHPALSPEARVALTLRSLGGLTTAEIARAFLTTEATMYQRLTRARNKIRLAGIPVEMPSSADLPDRLDSVLAVIYLVFNEGYSPLGGDELVRVDLCSEAIRLAEMMVDLMPGEAEPRGLAALCLLTDARRPARADSSGSMVMLEDQDRSSWDGTKVDRGLAHLDSASKVDGGGAYALQALIAAEHARARTWADTDWDRIVDLYEGLLEVKPSPVVLLNLAAAMAMRDGPDAGLALMSDLEEPLEGYQPFHASRAELFLRGGRFEEAAAGFERALCFAVSEPERRHLEARMAAARNQGAGL